jgi:hypothetical protein
MTYSEFKDRFVVNVKRDIEPSLSLEKEFIKTEKELRENGGMKFNQCQNCGFFDHIKMLESEPWTYVQCCNDCNRVNVLIPPEPMGGGSHDWVVIVYKEREK